MRDITSEKQDYSMDDITVDYEIYKNERFMIIKGPEGVFAKKIMETDDEQIEIPLTDTEKQYFKDNYVNFQEEMGYLPPIYQQKIDEKREKAREVQVKQEQERKEYNSKIQYGAILGAVIFVVIAIAFSIACDSIESSLIGDQEYLGYRLAKSFGSNIDISSELSAKLTCIEVFPYLSKISFVIAGFCILLFFIRQGRKIFASRSKNKPIQGSETVADELLKYAQLLEKSLITQEEFEKAKERLLDNK